MQQAKRSLKYGMVSNAGLQAAAASSTLAASQLMGQGLAGAFQTTADNNQAIAQIRAMLAKQRGASEEFTMAVAEDVPEIEAERGFLAETTMCYLALAENPEPFLRATASFAQGKPGLEEELASAEWQNRTGISPEWLVTIGRAIRDMELLVV